MYVQVYMRQSQRQKDRERDRDRPIRDNERLCACYQAYTFLNFSRHASLWMGGNL